MAVPASRAGKVRGRPLWCFALGVAFLGVLVCLGFILRIYRLGEQSAWCDECNYFWLSTPDLATYLAIVRFWGPDNLPLYYIVHYAWCTVFGISLVSARMMTVLCGIACIPLAFALGRRVYDARAGWIAAVCTALSPMQIWHAQSMRPYGLAIPLVLLTLYALLRAREGYRWWCVTFAANVLLLWIHPFMALLIPVQCLYLLGTRPHGLRRAAAWALANLLVVIPPFLWMWPRLSEVPDARYDHFTLPGLWKVLVDLVGDDVMRYSGEFSIGEPGWVKSVPEYAFLGPAAGVGLMVVLGVFTVWALPKALARWRAGDARSVLILGTIYIPVLALVCLSYMWRPCVETRHTPYATIALYVVAGGVISSLRRPAVRYLALAVLLGLLIHETAFFVSGVSRTCWNPAARSIQAQQKPRDIILVRGTIHWAQDAFMANRVDRSIPAVPALTIEAVCQKTIAFFREEERQGVGPNEAGRVWAVIELPFCDPRELERTFAERLGRNGVKASYVYYPGMEGLLLCRFARNPAAELVDPSPGTPPAPSLTDYASILEDLGLAGLDEDHRGRIVDALRKIIDLPFPLGRNMYVILSLLSSEEHEYELGEACARRAIDISPGYGAAHFALGVALAGEGRVAAPRDAFERAFALDPVIASLYGELARALYDAPNEQTAARQLRRLAGTGFPYPILRRLFLVEFPEGQAPDPGMISKDPSHRGRVVSTRENLSVRETERNGV